jgi:hypothetical protein
MFRRMTVALSVLGVLVLAGLARAADEPKQPGKEDLARAEKAVKEELARLKAPEAKVTPVADEATARAFPGTVFVAVQFRQYPVAFAPPEPPGSANVFALPKDGKLALIKDVGGLDKFFTANLPATKGEAAMKDAARAWLRLTQELQQDGFYKFQLMDDSTKVDGKAVSGKVVVMQGGNGEINVVLTFDDAGKLAKVSEKAELKRGPRPICQATKLLDPDPIVRRMAEQDLLIMGRFARPYLDEQRQRAGPELREAIDRLWRRILEDGR